MARSLACSWLMPINFHCNVVYFGSNGHNVIFDCIEDENNYCQSSWTPPPSRWAPEHCPFSWLLWSLPTCYGPFQGSFSICKVKSRMPPLTQIFKNYFRLWCTCLSSWVPSFSSSLCSSLSLHTPLNDYSWAVTRTSYLCQQPSFLPAYLPHFKGKQAWRFKKWVFKRLVGSRQPWAYSVI